ncbi:MAG: polyprenyl synthetase family protein, partial [Deltaproteobacteria bacterium]|nr:polyprenyl synthetase family protein [Deltaproteobacteria bacterium]
MAGERESNVQDTARRFAELGQQHLPAILRLIDEVVAGSCPSGSTLVPMCGYHLQTGGKRLRALLPLLVAEALGRDPAGLVPFGAACEMLHNATLVHDDVQDGDEMRRGQPTVWRRYGLARALDLGDAMFYFTLLLVQRLAVPPALGAAVTRRV